MSKMTVISELNQYTAYMKLEFVEFLEFIARIATAKYRHATDEGAASMTLASKLEDVLDDILRNYGLTRTEVVVELEEISESDDDY